MTLDASDPYLQSDMVSTQLQIANLCDEIKELLLSKNAKYGNSALDPVRVFSKSSPVEQILVRIDDKLSRINSGAGLIANDEDVINDLIGYLFLLKIAIRREQAPSLNSGSIGTDVITFGCNGYWPNDPWDGTDLDNPLDFLSIQSHRSPD